MDTTPSLRAAVGCVAISSNILRLLRQNLQFFLAMTTFSIHSGDAFS
ncbi:hypothetical protein RAMDARK_0493 [Rickettsia amblyommatis str. Darkwater]|nr:hypothetical protein RAMDARK_0493 [Rickettsia amblyommatis str. Darkwater]